MFHTQYKFKHLKNLDELRVINPGEIIGIGQSLSDTVPAKCISNDGVKMELLGNIDDKIMIRYNLDITNVNDFYPDGSILFDREGYNRKYIEPQDPDFERSKQELIKSNLWGLLR